MKTRLRNITITLEDNIARWARIEAARKDTSVSRFLASILKERMTGQDHYTRSMKRALARKPFLKSNAPYASREEIRHLDRLR